MQLSDLPLMLTVDEAADVLRIGRNLMYEAVAAGTVASVRIGRTIRIPRQALAALLEGSSVGGATPNGRQARPSA